MSFLSKNNEGFDNIQRNAMARDIDSIPSKQQESKLNTPTTSSTASHQHQQEQEMLASFSIPNPPVSTQQSSVAAEKEGGITSGSGDPPRTLWMGDLDPWLDENGIVDLWWQILHKNVTVKVIKPKNVAMEMNYSGLSHSGYCFIEFQSFDDAQQALSLNGQLLPDIAMPSQQQSHNPENQKKYFRLNWASGATLSAPIVQTPEYSLFVGDLSASTTEAHLLAFFQKSFPNSIKTVRVMTDPVSGKSRCFGFVRFTDELDRQRALIEMNGTWFGGRPLRVALATPRSNGRNRFQNAGNPYFTPDSHQDILYISHPPPPPPQLGSSFGYYGNPQIHPESSMNSPVDINSKTTNLDSNHTLISSSSHPGHPYADPNNTTVFVGGLSSEVTEHTLFTLFKPFGIIQQVKIPPGKNCGFVKYSAREEAEEAIASMQGFIIGGNRVRLSWGRVSMNNRKFQQQQQQVSQAAQLQAAAALSMGMDPTSAIAAAAAAAAAAAGGYPPMTGQVGGMPPMGMPPSFQLSPNVPNMYEEDDYNKSPGNKNSYSQEPASMPPFYIPVPLGGHMAPSPGDELASAINEMNLGNAEKNEGNSEQFDRQGYMMAPPIFNGYPPEMQNQQFIPSPNQQSTNATNSEYSGSEKDDKNDTEEKN